MAIRIAHITRSFPELSEPCVAYDVEWEIAHGASARVYTMKPSDWPGYPSEQHSALIDPLIERVGVGAHNGGPLRLRHVVRGLGYWARAMAARRAHRSRLAMVDEKARFGREVWLRRMLDRFAAAGKVGAFRADVLCVRGGNCLPLGYWLHLVLGTPFTITFFGSDMYLEHMEIDPQHVQAASIVNVVSEDMRRFAMARFPALQRPILVAPSTTIGGTRPPPERDWRRNCIVCVARLEPVKGHKYLIDACAILRAAGVRFQCLLIGDGTARPELEQQICRAGLEGQVILLGMVPHAELPKWLAESTLLVQPSLSEGRCLAVIEGMLAGLPAVVTRAGGLPSNVAEGVTGLVVPPGDAAALAGAIQGLLSDPDRLARMGQQSHAKVLRDHTPFGLSKAVMQAFARLDSRRCAAANIEPRPNISGAWEVGR